MSPRGGGQPLHKGLLAQNWAALSLFVQSLSDAGFKRIKFEQPGFADFILEFGGKKIICESKSDKITRTKLKETLSSLSSINKKDEILIIGSTIDSRLAKNVEHAKYPEYLRELTQNYFDFLDDRNIALLPRVKFWSVTPAMNEDAVRGLMERQFDLWLPTSDLTNQLFMQRVLQRSANHGTYTKEEFLEDIAQYRSRLSSSDDAEREKRATIDRIEEIRKDFPKLGRIAISSGPIQQLVSEPRYHKVAIEELSKLSNLKLEAFDLFWTATYCSRFSHQVANIFEKNIFVDGVFNLENANYAVEFVEQNAERIRYSFWDEFGYKEALDLLKKIQAATHDFDFRIAELVIQFYGYASEDVFYVRQQHSGKEWILNKIAEFLGDIYDQEKVEIGVKEVVEKFAFSFNLVRDESELMRDTPLAVFGIVREFIGRDIEKLDYVIEKIIKDYTIFYRQFGKGLAYKGWDHFGGTSSNFSGKLDISDRAFVNNVLIPVLTTLSSEDRWLYLVNRITRKVNAVGSAKPDFINRAAIPFLLDWYASGEHQEDAREILSDFIRMRKGIPHKVDRIYLQLYRHSDIDINKKWQLLDVGLQEYGYPISAFMDLPFQQLIGAGHIESLVAFEGLLTNDEYMRRQAQFLDVTVTQNIQVAIESEKNFITGLKWLKTYLNSKWFKKGINRHDAYDVRKLILSVIERDDSEGLALIRSMAELYQPTPNQQVVFGYLLRDLPETYLETAYVNIVKPLLKKAGNAKNLAKTLTEAEARENIVWFGEKLGKQHKADWLFEILDFFKNDPDPEPGNRSDQEIESGKSQFTIDSVRGVVAWTLTQFPIKKGEVFDRRVLDLVEVLCSDSSSFVRNYACFALAALMMNRHSKLARTGTWYMDAKTAKEIEDLSFSMLNDPRNHHAVIMLGLAEVFSHMRNISQVKAVEVIQLFEKYGGDLVFENLTSYIIFLAEFRRDAFSASWPADRGGIKGYDPVPVQVQLCELLRGDSEEIRSKFAWQFTHLLEEAGDDQKKYERYFKISLKYLRIIVEHYDKHVFTSIYHFIEKNIDRHFKECYELWRLCLKVERPACVENKEAGLQDYSWWPFSKNGSILSSMAVIDLQRFLDDFEFLVGYPDGSNYAHDLGKAVENLIALNEPKDQIERIFQKLMLWHYDDYQKWKQRIIK